MCSYADSALPCTAPGHKAPHNVEQQHQRGNSVLNHDLSAVCHPRVLIAKDVGPPLRNALLVHDSDAELTSRSQVQSLLLPLRLPALL